MNGLSDLSAPAQLSVPTSAPPPAAPPSVPKADAPRPAGPAGGFAPLLRDMQALLGRRGAASTSAPAHRPADAAARTRPEPTTRSAIPHELAVAPRTPQIRSTPLNDGDSGLPTDCGDLDSPTTLVALPLSPGLSAITTGQAEDLDALARFARAQGLPTEVVQQLLGTAPPGTAGLRDEVLTRPEWAQPSDPASPVDAAAEPILAVMLPAEVTDAPVPDTAEPTAETDDADSADTDTPATAAILITPVGIDTALVAPALAPRLNPAPEVDTTSEATVNTAGGATNATRPAATVTPDTPTTAPAHSAPQVINVGAGEDRSASARQPAPALTEAVAVAANTVRPPRDGGQGLAGRTTLSAAAVLAARDPSSRLDGVASSGTITSAAPPSATLPSSPVTPREQGPQIGQTPPRAPAEAAEAPRIAVTAPGAAPVVAQAGPTERPEAAGLEPERAVPPALSSGVEGGPWPVNGSTPPGTVGSAGSASSADATTIDLGPQPQAEALGEQLADRIAAHLGREAARSAVRAFEGERGRDAWTLKLALRPAELGPVQVELRLQDGQLAGDFSSASASTRQLLQDGLGRLREQLQAHGMEVAEMGVNGGQDGRFNGNPTPRHPPRPQPAEGDTSRRMDASTVHASATRSARPAWTGPDERGIDLWV